MPVVVTVLGEGESRHTGIITNASSRGLALSVPAAIAPGTALKIEWDDAMVLGEAVFCRAASDDFLVGVELDQMLCGLTQLSRRLREFHDAAPQQPSYSARALRNG
jgi:hypothetical protein